MRFFDNVLFCRFHTRWASVDPPVDGVHGSWTSIDAFTDRRKLFHRQLRTSTDRSLNGYCPHRLHGHCRALMGGLSTSNVSSTYSSTRGCARIFFVCRTSEGAHADFLLFINDLFTIRNLDCPRAQRFSARPRTSQEARPQTCVWTFAGVCLLMMMTCQCVSVDFQGRLRTRRMTCVDYFAEKQSIGTIRYEVVFWIPRHQRGNPRTSHFTYGSPPELYTSSPTLALGAFRGTAVFILSSGYSPNLCVDAPPRAAASAE